MFEKLCIGPFVEITQADIGDTEERDTAKWQREREKGREMPVVKVKFMPYTHKPKDFREIYKYLTDRFVNDIQNCPAVLFFTEAEVQMFEDSYGDSVIFLDRNSSTLRGDLRRALSRPSEKIDRELAAKLQTVWSPSCNYGVLYTWLLEIGNSLRVDIPALFLCEQMAPGITELGGAAFPGDDVPFVTDIVIRINQDQTGHTLKTLLHEMRHVHQHKYYNEMFNGYNKYAVSEKKKYSLQVAEIDADAYAYWVLAENGVTFHMEDLGEELCTAIKERMLEISKVEKAPVLSCLAR